MVLWVPAGDNRPYQAPVDRKTREKCYFVRQGPETIIAKGETLRQLLELTARTPFDDRRNQEASILDLSPILVKRYLQEVNSDLLNQQTSLPDVELYKALRIIVSFGETYIHRNVRFIFQ
jgi:ATP-dependent DNA helicase RecG